jgi:RNA polymerase sigma-70 factor (ECF subfamily)
LDRPRFEKLLHRFLPQEAQGENIEQLADVKSSLNTPFLILEEKEKMRAIRDSIDSLPPILRSCIVLRNLYGHSYQDIAKILNIPEGTVKSRINRGRIELSKRLGVAFRRTGSAGRKDGDSGGENPKN